MVLMALYFPPVMCLVVHGSYIVRGVLTAVTECQKTSKSGGKGLLWLTLLEETVHCGREGTLARL